MQLIAEGKFAGLKQLNESQSEYLNKGISTIYEIDEWSANIEKLLGQLHYLRPGHMPGNFANNQQMSDLGIVVSIQSRLHTIAKQKGRNFNRTDLSWLEELERTADSADWYSVRQHIANLLYEEIAQAAIK